MSALQFLIGDHAGRILAELTPEVGSISWRLSDIGQVAFRMARSDPKMTTSYLSFGNRVLIQFDNGLPAWGGVIDPPRNWQPDMVECTAYSAEYLFSLQTTGKNTIFTSSTVGIIYHDLIEQAIIPYNVRFFLGSIYSVGNSYTRDYHYTELLSVFREYLTEDMSDADFDVTAAESDGYIVFTANLYERKGALLNNYALVEGQNAVITQFSEQGKIVNAWYIVGKGNTWDSDRLVGYAQDAASINTYGYRVMSAIRNDTDSQAELDAEAGVALAESKDPHNMFEILASNNLPAQFGDYGVGDSLRVIAPSVGFGGLDTTARVVARNYTPSTGLCELVMREDT